MKKMILMTAIMAIFFTLICPYFVTGSNPTNFKNSLCKKWHLNYCKYFFKKYPPEEKEKNDYILFNANMTYESVDEDKKSTGKWSCNAKEKYVIMYKGKEKVKLEIESVTDKELVFEIDDKELKGVDFFYSAEKQQ